MTTNDKVRPRILSGFMELLPADQLAFSAMLDTIRAAYERYGFTPLDTVAVELTDILFAKAGGTIDKEIYQISNRGDDIALRFDLTVPLARYVAQNYGQLTYPFRRYQIGKVWRAERSQKGRFREFYQCDADVIGSFDPRVDAELISLIADIFSQLELGDFTIRINNRKILGGLLASLTLSENTSDVLRVIDKIEKIGEEKVRAELTELGIDSLKSEAVIEFTKVSGSGDQILSKLEKMNIDNEVFNQGRAELAAVLRATSDFGLPKDKYKVDLAIARGLDYYTGTVFETTLDDYAQIGSVCSGGRFDDLAGYYIDKELPGVGISIGLTRLFYQLKQAGLIKSGSSTPTQVLVVKTDDKCTDYCLNVATKLRVAGINTQIYFEDEKIGKQFKYADKLGIAKVIVVGEKEISDQTVTLRDMSSGEQKTVSIDQAIKEFK